MTAQRLVPIRVRVLGLLFVLSFVNYLLRNNLSAAAPAIGDEFRLSEDQLGWIIGSFNFSYALLQIPGGLFGDRFGPRRALMMLAVCWGVLTALTGFAPSLMAASATGAMVSLMVVRLAMGAAQAPLFPVGGATVASWFPPGSWAFPNAALSSALTLGQAAIGPVVTYLIVRYGWRESFYILTPTALFAAALWWWYARDNPREHPAVTADEISLIEAGRAALTPAPQKGDLRRALLNRNLLLLAASYFCMNYVFYIFAQWLFLYLVKQRGFSLLETGMLASLPFVTGAVLAAVGGLTCDALCRKLGPTWGCRLPAMVALALVAVFLLAGVYAPHPYVAVALLSLCFGFTQFTEGPFWSAATFAGRSNVATACGILNTGGNAPGLLAPLIGFMVVQLGYMATFASGAIFALLGAVLWMFVKLPEGDAQKGQTSRP